jgi:hypothetical protein
MLVTGYQCRLRGKPPVPVYVSGVGRTGHTEMLPETSVIFNQLTRLIARKDFLDIIRLFVMCNVYCILTYVTCVATISFPKMDSLKESHVVTDCSMELVGYFGSCILLL